MSDLIQRSGLNVPAKENANTTKYRAIQAMDKVGYNPVTELIDLSKELSRLGRETSDADLLIEAGKIHTNLLKYFSAAPKQEIDMKVEQQHQIVLQPAVYANTKGIEKCSPRIVDVTPRILDVTVDE